MTSLHDRVIAVLDEQQPENGAIIVADGRLLATRDPTPDGGTYLVILDAEK